MCGSRFRAHRPTLKLKRKRSRVQCSVSDSVSDLRKLIAGHGERRRSLDLEAMRETTPCGQVETSVRCDALALQSWLLSAGVGNTRSFCFVIRFRSRGRAEPAEQTRGGLLRQEGRFSSARGRQTNALRAHLERPRCLTGVIDGPGEVIAQRRPHNGTSMTATERVTMGA